MNSCGTSIRRCARKRCARSTSSWNGCWRRNGGRTPGRTSWTCSARSRGRCSPTSRSRPWRDRGSPKWRRRSASEPSGNSRRWPGAWTRHLKEGDLDDEPAVPVDHLAVPVDLRAVPQLEYHVPVQPRGVPPSGVGVRGAEGHVERSPDLLVKQDVPRPPLNVVVEAEGELPEGPRPRVQIQHRLKEVLPF